jgi:hypothetical protein
LALYELTHTSITKLDETTFGSQAITERAELRSQLGWLVRPVGLRRSRRQLRVRFDSNSNIPQDRSAELFATYSPATMTQQE